MLLTNLTLGVVSALTLTSSQAELTPEGIEFFESRIRPVLAQDCYECHQTNGKRKGGLALDHRASLLEGGDSGATLVPGNVKGSLLLRVIRHEEEDLKMPKAGAKLEDAIIADFEKWVAMGAPDPRDGPPSAEAVEADQSWEALMTRRKQWWSFQPIEAAEPPAGNDPKAHSIDRFVRAKLGEPGLPAAEETDRHTLIRRLSFVLRGLPPTPDEIAQFIADSSETAYENLVDTYLESPRYGERWARHWMDWVRYADSHGSEGDPNIPYSWQYRDYLIRALNADVPYDQMAREHLAGDLLENPRINASLGINESAIGPAHLRMVFHGFAPTDALDEQVRFTDDQINVVSKAFLGLTISCARCHNHKFDAISQNDFYSWYGIFASCPPASIGIDAPSEKTDQTRQDLTVLKSDLKAALITDWLEQTNALEASLEGRLNGEIEKAKDRTHLLHPFWAKRKQKDLEPVWETWRAPSAVEPEAYRSWDFSQESSLKEWRQDGRGGDRVSSAGTYAVAPEGENALIGIYPAGVYSHTISTKDRGVLLSPRVMLDDDYELWMEVAGDRAHARYAVQNYPRNGTVYPVKRLNGSDWRWERFNLDYWRGDHIHVEITTAADQPVLADMGATRSWFGVRKVMLTPKDQAPARDAFAFARPLLAAFDRGPSLSKIYAQALQSALKAWQNDTLSNDQALFLNKALQIGLLSNAVNDLKNGAPIVASYRTAENSLPVPTRAPGVLEKDAYDQPFFERGNHKTPSAPVPRHFLDAIDGAAYEPQNSGRLALANDLFRSDNPLTKRVIVNRIWHHVFGEGLVRTPDNLGRLGEKPSHPALLDHLADWFVSNDYSIKSLIRYLVTSDTWKAASSPSEEARKKDPDNRLLSHAHVRRLEAEAIRDTLLAVSGSLEEDAMYGPPAGGDSPRRSVYLRVKRNNLDRFLSTFDAPVPASTKGRRDVTNVPSQSLTMLNDRFVIGKAAEWEDSLKKLDDDEQIRNMFLQALGREPNDSEITQAEAYLENSLSDADSYKAAMETLEERLEALESQRSKLRETATARVLAKRERNPDTERDLPQPIALWEFDGDLKDSVGELHGEAHGKARVSNGHLVLNGKGSYVSTLPLRQDLKAKTLEVWVQLNNEDQRAGGAITVQDLQGVRFDSIVYAERESRRWMAGSDGFSRTKNFGGPAEEMAKENWVHFAIVYDAQGKVTGYRNGTAYGQSYQTDGPHGFQAGASQILFGCRHATGNEEIGLLRGKIDKAALYARALSAQEIAASATGDPNFVSAKDRLAAMTAQERDQDERLGVAVEQAQKALEDLRSRNSGLSGLADLAHVMFNLKEFIYLR